MSLTKITLLTFALLITLNVIASPKPSRSPAIESANHSLKSDITTYLNGLK